RYANRLAVGAERDAAAARRQPHLAPDREQVRPGRVHDVDVQLLFLSEVDAALTPELARRARFVSRDRDRAALVAADRALSGGRRPKHVHAQLRAETFEGAQRGVARTADADARG